MEGWQRELNGRANCQRKDDERLDGQSTNGYKEITDKGKMSCTTDLWSNLIMQLGIIVILGQ